MQTIGKTRVPGNARDAALQGANFLEGFATLEDCWTGPNSAIRTGEVEPDGADIVVPFTAKITYGKPRRATGGRYAA